MCRRWSASAAAPGAICARLPRAGVARRFGAALLEALDARLWRAARALSLAAAAGGVRPEGRTAGAGHHRARTDVERAAPAVASCRSGCRRAIAACWRSNWNGRWTCGGSTACACPAMSSWWCARPSRRRTSPTCGAWSASTWHAPACRRRPITCGCARWRPCPGAAPARACCRKTTCKGERLHQLVERLSVRLGEAQRAGAAGACRSSARTHAALGRPAAAPMRYGAAGLARRQADRGRPLPCDALYPPWLLPQPLRLEVRGEKPQYHGPLRLLAGPAAAGDRLVGCRRRRARPCATTSSRAATRPGCCGSTASGWPRTAGRAEPAPVRWFLHGVYA